MINEVWKNPKTLRYPHHTGLLTFETRTWLDFEANKQTQREKLRQHLRKLEQQQQQHYQSQQQQQQQEQNTAAKVPTSYIKTAQPKIETPKGCKHLLNYLAITFAEQTSITALYRLLSVGTNKGARALWCIGFVFALGLLLYTSSFIAARYNRKQFETIIDTTNYPIFKIPFPELVFCNEDRLNWARLAEAKNRFLWRKHRKEPYESFFTRVIIQYNSLGFGEFDKFEFLANTSESLLRTMNYVNFTNVVEFMAWRCNEMFKDCVWRNRPYNCCDIIFPRRTQSGSCLAFNTVQSPEGKRKQKEDPMWPWRISNSGPGSGLQMKLLLPNQRNGPINGKSKGVQMMVLETHVWSDYAFYVSPDTNTIVTLNAVYHWYDEDTRAMTSHQRKCVFRDEYGSEDYYTLQGIPYMYENCLAECQQWYLRHFCNCSLDLFFPPGQYLPCKLVDLPCLARRNDRMLFYEQEGERDYVGSYKSTNIGMVCDCFLSCYSLTYITDVRPTTLRDEERDPLNQTAYIIFDFHFQRDFILVYRSYLVFTWVDLLVSFGGITGLFLGCSLISLIELVYFVLLDMPKLIWREHLNVKGMSSKRRKSSDSTRKLMVNEYRK